MKHSVPWAHGDHSYSHHHTGILGSQSLLLSGPQPWKGPHTPSDQNLEGLPGAQGSNCAPGKLSGDPAPSGIQAQQEIDPKPDLGPEDWSLILKFYRAPATWGWGMRTSLDFLPCINKKRDGRSSENMFLQGLKLHTCSSRDGYLQ